MINRHNWSQLNSILSCDDCKFKEMCSTMNSQLSTFNEAEYRHRCPVEIRHLQEDQTNDKNDNQEREA